MLPSSSDRPFATAEDQRRCRDAIVTGSRSFYTASKLLPASVRRPAYGLYAFCRLSDDAVDLDGGSLQALNRLYFRLERAYRGRPLPNYADRAMADLLKAHAIPVAIPEALLEGLGWDAQGRRYETISDLHAYAARVASTVGVMMTLLMDVRLPSALARACDLGAAMQLTNIARDVGEDARNGRVYLPLQWLDEAGIDVAGFLNDPQPTPALRLVVGRLLEEARRLYAQARAGIAELPRACRPAILAASTIYADIGREVAEAGFDSITQRAHTSGKRKLGLLAQALIEAPRIAADSHAAVLPACAFLIDAMAAHHPKPRVAPRGLAAFAAPFVRTLDLFERLERAEMFD
jgi:phytoene synthase